MSQSISIKSNHKSIKEYHIALEKFAGQHVDHESAVRRAFEQLLESTAKLRGWMLIPELSEKSMGRTIRPDGTLRDVNGLPRGYWEAKDTNDSLEEEIRKKIDKGYPLTNIIFEDTQRAVLYQNKKRAFAVDLSNAQEIADLLNAFYNYTEPDHEEFEKAVDGFKERVPDLARGLADKIANAHETNAKFQAAFEQFFDICRSSLNPNLSRDAVNEMLVQHLLTERLLRTIFNNPEFTKRNVIAAEVENVITALLSKSFNRDEFLQHLDPFYVAIENAARTLTDFHEKQQLLNSVYERFFQGYCVKVADTHGIVYTPGPIVDFMCNSVVEVLQNEFGKNLGDEGVNVLDPCTGTGNFVVHLLQRVKKRDLPRFYKEQLFANEVMLLPYYIAALNIEHAYYELTGEYEPFEGICFVDTLDLADHQQQIFACMTEENTARVERQKNTPITVIIGNPPYNVGQLNENDNNKNRKYAVIDERVKFTYARHSKATNKNATKDMYVKFFRWATDRLNGKDGIVCFVSNNSFVHKYALDGMRKHFLEDFHTIYHVDLHGDVRQNPKISGTSHNVFGIKVGVGITVAVRKKSRKKRTIYYTRVPEFWRREEKYVYLNDKEFISKIKWKRLKPDNKNNWLAVGQEKEFHAFLPMGDKLSKRKKFENCTTIFNTYSRGVATCRDDTVYDFQENKLLIKVRKFVKDYNSEVDRYRREEVEDLDEFVDYKKLKWSMGLKTNLKKEKEAEFKEEKIRESLYRPFTKKFLFFDRVLNEAVYQINNIYPKKETENLLIVSSDVGYRASHYNVFISNIIPDLHLIAPVDAHQCFPFYVYSEDGVNRRENITDWALNEFRQHYQNDGISKWDIFYYVYGLLHHPGYRERYGENLKRELPRIPFAPDFHTFAKMGKELAEWHLHYEKVEPYELAWVETPDTPLSYRVEKMRLSRDRLELKVNNSLTLRGIPPETFAYCLGNRSALEWVIDQYQVKEHKRSGIVSDPNREDDPEYIVRLVGQVIRVSQETIKILEKLPQEFEKVES
ncbi:MAG: DNA helicase [Candidatus Omnitrophota bacterium]|jgi:predicted helicase|nr:MAG: DNA helicase [Candidatus Omnitrophota bacterium]